MSETLLPDQPPYPIYDADHLYRRIAALTPERQQHLSEIWRSQGYGQMPPLMTADEYLRYERLVDNAEDPAPAFHQADLADKLKALPAHIQANAAEAMRVYAGMEDPTRWIITGVGRLAEVRRIVEEAVAYAATLEDEPTVADLPPVDDTAEQVASAEYPGTKSDAKTVMAWVGDDMNRAARAYAHETLRSTVRKGVMSKLEAVLGDEGLAKVKEAIAATAAPPLDLGAAPAADTEMGLAAGGTDDPSAGTSSDDDSGHRTLPVESSPPAVTPPTTASPQSEAVVAAYKMIAAGFTALAEALS